MKWVCVGVDEQEKGRFQKLNQLLAKSGEFEVSFQDWNTGTELEKQFDGFQHLRWGQAVQLEATRLLKAHSTWTTLLGVTDGMVFRDQRWWPLCASYEAFSQTLTGIGQGLDIDASAFVAGTGGLARAAIAALFKAGFRKFRITSESQALSEELIVDLRRRLFGIDLEVVPLSKIVLLAGVSSLFVNTVREEEAPNLIQEISYLNFLKRPGAIIDTNLYTKGTLLLKEATDSAIPVIDGWTIAARTDAIWTEWAFAKTFDMSEYLKALKQAAASSPLSDLGPVTKS